MNEKVHVLWRWGIWPRAPLLCLECFLLSLAPQHVWTVFWLLGCFVFKVLIVAGWFPWDSLLVATLHSVRFLSTVKCSHFLSASGMEWGLREAQLQPHIYLWTIMSREGVWQESPYLCPESALLSCFTGCFLKKNLTFSLLNSSLNVSIGNGSINLKNEEVY